MAKKRSMPPRPPTGIPYRLPAQTPDLYLTVLKQRDDALLQLNDRANLEGTLVRFSGTVEQLEAMAERLYAVADAVRQMLLTEKKKKGT